jgi:hypothetical protein
MRAKEFITETTLSKVHDGLDVASMSLPNTYVIPDLKNSDFYDLYRFGVAFAAVRGESGNDGVQNGFEPKFRAESSWGEHQVVSSEFDKDVGNTIDQALKKVGKSGKKLVSTPGSDEMDDTVTQSPIKGFKGYKRK